ncbi:MAG: recombination protein O N-terminal domain-containing protein [Patescibacteria group bacterium]
MDLDFRFPLHYHTYNTLGLILGSAPSGEASRYVYVFTKDLGLVGAHAQNTRNINSKLRYALDAPARSHVSLVRGKNMWRLISAVPDKRFYSVFKENPEKQRLCARTFSLIKKLLAGEEANPELFAVVNEFLDFIEKEEQNTLKDVEAILVLRILHYLGYIPGNDLTRQFAHSTGWNSEIISAMAPRRKEAVKIINESLRETGL